MSLEPLFAAGPTIAAHALAALAALVLGLAQFALPKGTPAHRWTGRVWVVLMVAVALSSFFIHTIGMLGPFSAIHLLSIFTLFALAMAIRAIRRGAVASHKGWMIGTFVGGLIVAGGFTLLPGRVMHAVVTGG
ncbi:MAG: DUF2306 domain-containing protein [Azospirillaceae bacterium]